MYLIVQANLLIDLVTKVNNKALQCLVPLGAPFTLGNTIAQAMILDEAKLEGLKLDKGRYFALVKDLSLELSTYTKTVNNTQDVAILHFLINLEELKRAENGRSET